MVPRNNRTCVSLPSAVTSSTVVSCAGLEDEGPGDPDRRLLQLRTGANIEIEMLASLCVRSCVSPKRV